MQACNDLIAASTDGPVENFSTYLNGVRALWNGTFRPQKELARVSSLVLPPGVQKIKKDDLENLGKRNKKGKSGKNCSQGFKQRIVDTSHRFG